jgi:hypothetical protein
VARIAGRSEKLADNPRTGGCKKLPRSSLGRGIGPCSALSGLYPNLFDRLVIGLVMPANPAHPVRGPRHSVTKGFTPVLFGPRLRRDFSVARGAL